MLWLGATAVWLGMVVYGLALVAAYDNRPGPAGDAGEAWPSGSRFVRLADRPTLVMFVHPQCDCSRASVAELAELLARASTPPRVYVAILKPASLPEEWDHTAIRQAAAAIAGVIVARDDDGREARLFGARTSGQTMLFDADGRLMFSGGLTSARAHRGPSVGHTALLAILNHQPTVHASAVFGCALFAADEPPPTEATERHP